MGNHSGTVGKHVELVQKLNATITPSSNKLSSNVGPPSYELGGPKPHSCAPVAIVIRIINHSCWSCRMLEAVNQLSYLVTGPALHPLCSVLSSLLCASDSPISERKTQGCPRAEAGYAPPLYRPGKGGFGLGNTHTTSRTISNSWLIVRI